MKINYFYLKKTFIIFIIGLSFMLSSCSDDSSLLGDEKKPEETPTKAEREIATSINGILVDGYIKNAIVCVDTNNDGSCLGEIQTKTNDKGEFSLTFTAKEGTSHTIMGTGGIDTATNKRFNGTYKNIITVKDDNSRAIQSLNITPITTIIAHIYIVETVANPNYSISSARNKVATSLGLSKNQVSTDPLKNKEVFKKTQQVVQTISILSSTMQADETNANTKKSFDFVMSKLSESVNTGEHKGELNVNQVVTTLNESSYDGKEVSIKNDVVTLVKDNVKNISEKVNTSDGADLTTIQAETQKATDSIVNNVGPASVVINTPPPAAPPAAPPADTTKPVWTSSDTVIKVYEKTTNVATVKATDTNAITYSVGGSDGSSFNVDSSGVITFKTAPNYIDQTTYSLTAIATDSKGNKATQNLIVNILAVDSVNPIWTSSNAKSVKENQIDVMILKATDVNTITYSISGSDADKFNLDSSSGKIAFKTAPDYETIDSYSITATAKDESNNEATQNITITITDVDENDPVFSSSNEKNVSENQTDAITLQATDASSITFHISESDADKFNLDSSSGKVTFKVAPDYETKTTYSFSAVAQDVEDNNATQDIIINIDDIDENAEDKIDPVFTSPSTIDVHENETNVITLKATDTNAITYSLSQGGDDNFTIDSASGVIAFKVAPDYESTIIKYTFSAIATDAKNNKATQNITVNIKDVDEVLPVFVSATYSITVDEGQTDTIMVKATDTNTITYGLSGGDSDKFNINSSDGNITFKVAPSYEDKSSYTFVATATDEAKNEATQSVTISIKEVDNKAPVFTSSNSADVNEGESSKKAITLVATDDNTSTYSIADSNDGASFSVDSTSGVVTFKDLTDYETKTTYTFIAVAKDDFGNSANKKITINIINANDEKPIFTSDSYEHTTPENIKYKFNLKVTDADGDSAITYTITGTDGDPSVDSEGNLSFADLDFEASEKIAIVVTANDGVHSITQDINITLTDVDDDAPVFTSKKEANVSENTTDDVITLVATDAGTSIVYGISGTDSSSFTLTGAVVTFTSPPDYETKTSYSLTATATDSLNNKATQTININIDDLNDEAPVFTSDSSYSTKENEEFSFTVKTTDKDANSEVTYSVEGSSFASIEEDGKVSLEKINYELNKEINITVTADDGENKSTQKIGIVIEDVDENPPEFTSADKADVQEGKKKVIQLKTNKDGVKYNLSDDSTFSIGEDDWLLFKVAPKFADGETYTLDVNATDSIGNTATQTITITIIERDANAPKFTSDDNVDVDENQGEAITLQATPKVSGHSIAYSISGGDSASLDVNSSTGVVKFKIFPDYEVKTLYDFEAKARDEGGNETIKDVHVHIKNLDDNSPIFTSSSKQVAFINEENAMTLVAKDADGDDVSYTISGGDSSIFKLDASSGNIKFKTIPTEHAEYNFIATATAEGKSVTQDVNLSVKDSIYISICSENQADIKFYGSITDAKETFEQVWQEGVKDTKDKNVIHFNKINNIYSYRLDVLLQGYSLATFIINRTTSIINISFLDDDSVSGIGASAGANGDIYLKSSLFDVGQELKIQLTATKTSGSPITTATEEITTTIGQEYNTSRKPIGLHFTKATSNSVSLAWCESGTEKYRISSYDTDDSTKITKDVNDLNGTVDIVHTSAEHSFAVAGVLEDNESGTFSNIIKIVPVDSGANKVNFKISKVTFNQSVQIDMTDDANSIPVIAGKPGVLRVFVKMENSNLVRRKVEIRLSGTSGDGKALPAITKEVLLEDNVDFATSDSTNKPVVFLLDSEIWLKEDNNFSVTIDPNSKIEEANENDNAYPASGEKPFGFENITNMIVHFVPITTQNGTPSLTQDFADGARDYLKHIYPLNNVSVIIDTTRSVDFQFTNSGTNAMTLINTLGANKKVDVANDKASKWTFYVGVYMDDTTFFDGIAVRNHLRVWWAAASLESLVKAPKDTNDYVRFYKTLAHELAHNQSMEHLRSQGCLDPGDSIDDDYPYADAALGKTGYSQYYKALYEKEKYKDMMSYCTNVWISDYTYKKIYEWQRRLDQKYERVGGTARSIKTSQYLTEGRLISGSLSNNEWKIDTNMLYKEAYIANIDKEDFFLKVELVNGDIFEIPIDLLDVSHINAHVFTVFVPSTKEVKLIQVINTDTKKVIKVDF